MNREDVHRAWAPADEPWSAWVKPVLFAHLADGVTAGAPPPASSSAVDWLRRGVIEPLAAAQPAESHPYRADSRLRDTAFVIDVAGADGVGLGASVADSGWRPIPLYNAIPAPLARVDVLPIMQALVDVSARVAVVPPGAPPAFLLDANRSGRGGVAWHAGEPVFDNRSQHHASDFPSVETLCQAGIRRVVLVAAQPEPAFDLEPILLDWQQRGLALWRKRSDVSDPVAPFTLRRPSLLTRIWREVTVPLLSPLSDGSYGQFPAHGQGG